MQSEPIAWLRDLDGTGSLHVCSEGDPGAIAVYDDSPSPISADAVVEACSPDSKPIASWREQAAFEEWAKDSRYDMTQHPLHYLFVDKQTNAARQGWKAALAFIRALKGTFPAAPEAKSDVALKPLPWAKFERFFIARTPFSDIYGCGPWYELCGDWTVRLNGKEFCRAKDEQSAKAAAQADYETRVRSALVDPEGGL